MELWLNAAGEYGFPIAITFYLLYRIEKKLDLLNSSVLNMHQNCAAHIYPVHRKKTPDVKP